MDQRRVVVTGLGVVAASGHSVAEFWGNLSNGQSSIGPIEAVDTSSFRIRNGAEVKNFVPEELLPGQDLSQIDRFSQFGVIAAHQAVADAGITWTDALRLRTGVFAGTGIGGEVTHDKAYSQLYQENKPRLHPLTIPRIMPNANASAISMVLGTMGPTQTITTACASSNHALGQAFWMVRNGICDMMIAGGSEAPFCTGALRGWEALRVVAGDTCRPFSKDRQGLILGEGGAMLVLETLESAMARGARIYGEIAGFGMSADAGHITTPDVNGAIRAMAGALADAGLDPAQIDYINAHGTGTMVNDAMETKAIRTLFGDHADRLAVSSTKSMHGHALGASSAFEAIATILALHYGVIPPTANYNEPDPECDLDVVPNLARRQDIRYAVSNAFAFGGLNATLVLKKWVA